MSRNTKNVLNNKSRVILAFLFVYAVFPLDKVLAFSISDFKNIFPIGQRNILYVSNEDIEVHVADNNNMRQNNQDVAVNNDTIITNQSISEDLKIIDSGKPVDSEPYTENYYVDKPKPANVNSQSNNIGQKGNNSPIDYPADSNGTSDNKTVENASLNNTRSQNDNQNSHGAQKQENSINDSKIREPVNESESNQGTIDGGSDAYNKTSQSNDFNGNTNTNPNAKLDADKKIVNNTIESDNVSDSSDNRTVTNVNAGKDPNRSVAVASNDSTNNAQPNDKHGNSDSRYNVTDQNKYTSQSKAKVVAKQDFLSLDEIENLKQIENNNDITRYEEELYKLYDEMVSSLESKNSLDNNKDGGSNSRGLKKKIITQ